MDCRGGLAVPTASKEVRDRLPYFEQVLSKEDKEPTQGTPTEIQNRYKQYMSLQRKKEKEQANKLKAFSKLFQEVEQKYEKDEEGMK